MQDSSDSAAVSPRLKMENLALLSEIIDRSLSDNEEFNIRSLNEIERKEIRWLWQGRIPESTLTIIEGEGGRGKSTIVADICARLSSGICLPDDTTVRPSKRILLLSTEDDPGVVVRPRFEAHGANLSNVFIESQARTLSGKCLTVLAQKILELEIDVVVIDPIVSFMGTKIDMNSSTDVRSILAPLISLGSETGCTFVIVRHFNKSREGSASQRGAGSVDFRNSARSVMQVISSADQAYLALEKSNYAVSAKTLPFTICKEVSRIIWGEPCELSPDEILADSKSVDVSALQEACDFLKEELQVPLAATEIFERAKNIGISEKTLNRASKKLNIQKKRVDNRYIWRLVGQVGQPLK